MAHSTFRGGIHPFKGKRMSKDKPIKIYLPQGDLVYPLSQHIGAAAKAVVSVGDTVKIGDVIGKAGNGLSTFVHSSIDGKVISITNDYVILRGA